MSHMVRMHNNYFHAMFYNMVSEQIFLVCDLGFSVIAYTGACRQREGTSMQQTVSCNAIRERKIIFNT